jgi:isocitrate lyase
MEAMSLLRGLFWLVLFAFFTFCFVVLFEYGTHDFANGFKQEFERVKAYVQQTSKPAKADDKAKK